jgi:lantibiotic leader peptide-processing serine protease
VRRALLAAILVTTAIALGAPSAVLVSASAASQSNYIVLYKQEAVPANTASSVARAGGTVVASYPEIGVLVASSTSPTFAQTMRADARIEGVAATSNFASRLTPEQSSEVDASGPPPGDLPNSPASDSDSLSPLQWDMRQIHAPQAHAVTGGSRSVVVGDIDTGLDFTHPDLASNYDAAHSTDCTTGAPRPLLAGNDKNGHGTHTAGTIAAASNGIGIVGVAPNVSIAGIKAGNDAGFFFPEAVVCAFMWAGSTHVDVTNNSYFADPFLFNCRNDPVQRAIWKAEQRAITYAQQQGVTVVAAAGNQSEDLAHPTQDRTSPDTIPNPPTRDVTNACVVIPVEIPGVIGVTAVGNDRQLDSNGQPTGYLKSFYSSFGVGAVQLTAPGGDSIFGITPEAVNGRVLSTWPATNPCTRSVKEPPASPGEPTTVYCYLQGTSMASPHVAGVAALIISRFGNANTPQNGKLRPNQVKAYLDQTADPQPCPGVFPTGYLAILGVDDRQVQSCQGGAGYNSWYGKGQVNAFNAVTHTPGNQG